MPNLRLADGRPNVAAPPSRAAVRAGPPSAVQQARELYERQRREDAVMRKVLRLARAARRRAWRPPLVHGRPTSSPRARAARVQLVAIGGRDGTGERDDGSGGDDDSGGGSDPPSLPSPAHDIAGGAL
jgi:hypothetical protein